MGHSGVFCAASNAIEQCKTEGLVDVFQATKAVRMQKPGAVTNMVSMFCNVCCSNVYISYFTFCSIY